jgi:hypothetical protein
VPKALALGLLGWSPGQTAASALNLSASANGTTDTSMGRSPMDRPPRNPRAEGPTYKPSRHPPPRLLHRAPSPFLPLTTAP